MLRRTVLAGVAAFSMSGAGAQGIEYPRRSVKVVVPYPAGGPTDSLARLIFANVGDQLGQPFIIDNRPGAGGNTGAESVAHASKDGYTVLLVTTAHVINPFVFKKLPYDVLKDLTPVSLLSQGPLVLAVHPSLPVRSVRELIAYDKANPGKLNFASSGNGQSTHLSGVLFNQMAGTKLTHVPYKGSAPALADAVGGQVQVIFDALLSALPFIADGKLRALGVTTAQRSQSSPDIPTIAESGVSGYESAAFFGVMVPAGTPRSIVDKLNEALRTALGASSIVAALGNGGYSTKWTTPEEFRTFMEAELVKWKKAVATSGASVE
jgi:tripartite-type tricarboxylate transporter receptor subunit TctC